MNIKERIEQLERRALKNKYEVIVVNYDETVEEVIQREGINEDDPTISYWFIDIVEPGSFKASQLIKQQSSNAI